MPELPDDFSAGIDQQSYEPQAPSVSGVRDYLASQGYNVGDYDDASALQALTNLAVAPRPMDAQTARSLADYREITNDPEYHAWQAERRKSRAQPKAEEPPPKPASLPEWNVPDYDANWEKTLFTVDPSTGQPALNPNAPFSQIQKYRAYQEWKVNQADRLLREFPQLAEAYAQAAVQKKFEEWEKDLPTKFNGYLGRTATDAQTRQYLSQNHQDIYYTDQAGNVLANPQTGEEWRKPLGDLLYHHANQLRAAGISDPSTIQRYALQNAERDMFLASLPYYQQAQAQQQYQQQGRLPNGQFAPRQPTPQQRSAARKESYMQRELANHREHQAEGYDQSRSRNGAARAAKERQDFGEMMEQTSAAM